MKSDTQAKLLWAAVGTAVDCGATPDEVKKLFSARNVKFVLDMITEKASASRLGNEVTGKGE